MTDGATLGTHKARFYTTGRYAYCSCVRSHYLEPRYAKDMTTVIKALAVILFFKLHQTLFLCCCRLACIINRAWCPAQSNAHYSKELVSFSFMLHFPVIWSRLSTIFWSFSLLRANEEKESRKGTLRTSARAPCPSRAPGSPRRRRRRHRQSRRIARQSNLRGKPARGGGPGESSLH